MVPVGVAELAVNSCQVAGCISVGFPRRLAGGATECKGDKLSLLNVCAGHRLLVRKYIPFLNIQSRLAMQTGAHCDPYSLQHSLQHTMGPLPTYQFANQPSLS